MKFKKPFLLLSVLLSGSAFAMLGGPKNLPEAVPGEFVVRTRKLGSASLKALDTKNVHLILSNAPAKAEPALTTAIEEALAVRVLSPGRRATSSSR